MGILDTLLGKAKRSPQGRQVAAADPRKAVKQHTTLASRQVDGVKKIFKR